MLIPDLRDDTRFAPHAPARPVSALSVPLLQHHALIGTICVFDKIPVLPGQPAVFEERDLNLLVTLGTEAGIAIENARLYRAASQRAEELTALREVGEAIAGRLELSEVLEAVAAGAVRLLGSQHSQILLWDEEEQRLRYGSAVGSEAERIKRQSFAESRGVNAAVARARHPLLLDDHQGSPYALPEFPDILATITTPVMFGDRLLGVLHSHTTQPGKRFTPGDLRVLELLATQAAIAIENARSRPHDRHRHSSRLGNSRASSFRHRGHRNPSGHRLRARYRRHASSSANSFLNSCNDRGYSGRTAPDASPWGLWSQTDKHFHP